MLRGCIHILYAIVEHVTFKKSLLNRTSKQPCCYVMPTLLTRALCPIG